MVQCSTNQNPSSDDIPTTSSTLNKNTDQSPSSDNIPTTSSTPKRNTESPIMPSPPKKFLILAKQKKKISIFRFRKWFMCYSNCSLAFTVIIMSTALPSKRPRSPSREESASRLRVDLPPPPSSQRKPFKQRPKGNNSAARHDERFREKA